MTRAATNSRIVKAGCRICHGAAVHWTSANAQALAARHHDATGHETWYEAHIIVRYGTAAPDDRQIDIEDAIASASPGGRPDAAPLADSDAPAVPAADVSAPPKAARSKRALAAAKPEPAHV